LRQESTIAESAGGTEANDSAVGKPDGRIVGVGNDDGVVASQRDGATVGADDTQPPTIRAARVARVALTNSRPVGLAVTMAEVLPCHRTAFAA